MSGLLFLSIGVGTDIINILQSDISLRLAVNTNFLEPKISFFVVSHVLSMPSLTKRTFVCKLPHWPTIDLPNSKCRSW